MEHNVDRYFSNRRDVKKQIEYLKGIYVGDVGNPEGRKAQGSYHKADWERLRVWGKKEE